MFMIVYMQCVQITSELPLKERRITYIYIHFESTHRIVEVGRHRGDVNIWHPDIRLARFYYC